MLLGFTSETSGDLARLRLAASRLSESDPPQKVLKVPYRFMRLAAVALRQERVSAWVRAMYGTNEFFVKVLI